MDNLDPKKITDLSTPFFSTTKQLLNASFSFDIGPSLLKLWPLKVSYENRPISEKTPTYSPIAHAFFQKMDNLDQKKITDLSTPFFSTTKQLLNASFSFDIGPSLLKLWPLKVSYENRPISEKTPMRMLCFKN